MHPTAVKAADDLGCVSWTRPGIWPGDVVMAERLWGETRKREGEKRGKKKATKVTGPGGNKRSSGPCQDEMPQDEETSSRVSVNLMPSPFGLSDRSDLSDR